MKIQQLDTNLTVNTQSYALYTTFQVIAASLFLALSAQISIPLYFSPVPITGQTFAVLLIAALLGPRKAVLSVLAYLCEGAVGIPVFAGGSFGIFALMGPTGGYFLGMLIQAYFSGWYFESQKNQNGLITFGVLMAISIMQLYVGALWLAAFVGFSNAFVMGVYPFLSGAVLKVLAVQGVLKARTYLKK